MIHVTYKQGTWRVVNDKEVEDEPGYVLHTEMTKPPAIKLGRAEARERRTKLVIHKRNGVEQRTHYYPYGPRSIKD